jgi:hypothetical protein
VFEVHLYLIATLPGIDFHLYPDRRFVAELVSDSKNEIQIADTSCATWKKGLLNLGSHAPRGGRAEQIEHGERSCVVTRTLDVFQSLDDRPLILVDGN